MKKIFTQMYKLFFTTILFLASYTLFSQSVSNKGTEFLLGFMEHRQGTSAGMYLYITSDTSTTGTVSVPGQNWSVNFTVIKDSMTLVPIPNNVAYMGCTDCKQAKAIIVQAALPIVVYAHIYEQFFSDATLVLPVTALGQNYYAMSSNQQAPGFNSPYRGQMMIMASQDSTRVRITPRRILRNASNGQIPAGTPYFVTLMRGEAYQVRGFNIADDITGTKIEVIDTGKNASCKKIAVFSGSSYCSVGCNNSGDNLFHQMYPINTYGLEYFAVPFASRGRHHVRILASEDATRVRINGGAATIINQGEFITTSFDSATVAHISGNKPIIVAHFTETQGCSFSGDIGDPAMLLLSPTSQTLKKITLYNSDKEIILRNYINIVMPTNGISSFRLDGDTVTFRPIPTRPLFSFAQVPVTFGVHNLEANVGFLATAYGFGSRESYAYTAGANLTDQNLKIEFGSTKTNTTNSLCLGETSIFKGTAPYTVFQWEWDMGDGVKRFGSQINYRYRDTGFYTVKLKVTKENFDGCSLGDSTYFDIIVNDKPRTNFTWDKACGNEAMVFSANTSVGTGSVVDKYTWVLGDGTTGEGDTVIHRYSKADSAYTVTLFSITDGECRDTAVERFYVHSPPIVEFSSDTTFCFADTTFFMDLSQTDTGTINKWEWDFGDSTFSNTQNPKHLYTNFGTFTPQLIAYDSFGCRDTFIGSKIIKYSGFNVDFVNTDTCLSVGTNFIDSSQTDSTPFVTRIWEIENSTYSTANVLHKFDSAGLYTVKLIRSINSQCSDSISKQIQVFYQPSAAFSKLGNCLSDSIQFNSLSTLNQGNIAKSIWNIEGIGELAGNEQKIKFDSHGTKKIKLKIETDKGCIDSTENNIIVYRLPDAQFLVSNFCANDSISITNSSNYFEDVKNTIEWYYNGNLFQSSDNIKIKESSPGIKEVFMKITSMQGCEDTLTKYFQVYNLPIANFNTSDNCLNELSSFINTSTSVDGSINSYNWSNSENGTILLSENASFLFASPGSKTITLEISSDLGCKNSVQKNMNVFDLPQVSFSNNLPCVDVPVNFTNTSTIANGLLQSFQWIGEDAINSASSNTNHTYSLAGIYKLKLIAESSNGCKDSIDKNIEVFNSPIISIVSSEMEGCLPLDVLLTASIDPNTGTIGNTLWKFGDGSTSNQNPAVQQYNQVGSFYPKVIVTSDKGCVDSVSLQNPIVVHPLPTASASSDKQSTTIFENTINFVNNSSPHISRIWYFPDGSTSTDENSSFSFSDTGTYGIRLRITDDNQCEDEAVVYVRITAEYDVYIPNAFSPNGDLLNDQFKIEGELRYVQDFRMEILNRWGETVFVAKEYNLPWNGEYSGSPAPEGVYVVIVKFTDPITGEPIMLRSTLKLLR